MSEMKEFETKILKQSLINSCKKLYEMGYCVNRGICKKSYCDCIGCMQEFFTKKSFMELVKNENNESELKKRT